MECNRIGASGHQSSNLKPWAKWYYSTHGTIAIYPVYIQSRATVLTIIRTYQLTHTSFHRISNVLLLISVNGELSLRIQTMIEINHLKDHEQENTWSQKHFVSLQVLCQVSANFKCEIFSLSSREVEKKTLHSFTIWHIYTPLPAG